MRPFEFLHALLGQTAANLWRHKLRSFLTMFGIAWGVASLALMSALADGFRAGQRKNWEQIGNNMVALFPGKTSRQAGGQRAGRSIRLYEKTSRRSARNAPRWGWSPAKSSATQRRWRATSTPAATWPWASAPSI